MGEVKEAWVRFMAPVVPQSATALLHAIDRKTADGCQRVHLMISSPGGSVFHGLSIYNLLKGAPIEVVTYNFGSVDSIGVVIFCAGDRRVSVPHARLLLHGVSMSFQGNQTLDVELTRFCGHLSIGDFSPRKGSPHGKDTTALHAGVPR